MARIIRLVGFVTALFACGETLPAAESSPDGGASGGDAGIDAPTGDAPNDAGTSPDLVTTIVEPWRLAVAGSDLVVSSHAASGGGVFRAPKRGGSAVKVGLRSAYGVAVRGTNDVWFCNSEDAGPGLIQVPIDGGPNQERTNDACRDVAVEPNGDIAFTATKSTERILEDGGLRVFLSSGGGPEGVVGHATGVYFADRTADRIAMHLTGIGPGTLTATGSGPTRVRADGDYVYWVESGTNKVRRRTTAAGGSNEDVATGPDPAGEGGLAVDETHVYWVISHGPSAGLYRAPKDGGASEAVKTGMKFPVDVVVDAEHAYVTVHDENQVVRFSKK